MNITKRSIAVGTIIAQELGVPERRVWRRIARMRQAGVWPFVGGSGSGRSPVAPAFVAIPITRQRRARTVAIQAGRDHTGRSGAPRRASESRQPERSPRPRHAITFILALALLAAPLAAGAQPLEGGLRSVSTGSVSLTLTTNRSNVSPGAPLVLSVAIDNAGSAQTVDFYFGAVLPDGDTVVFFTDLAFHSAIGRLSSFATLRPIVAGINLSTPFTFANPNFFTYQWTGPEATGTYTLFLAALLSSGPTTAAATPGSIVALSTASVTFLSGPGVVEAFLERNDARGGTTIGQILRVSYEVPPGTIASVTISGGPFNLTPVPLAFQVIRNGQTFDVFFMRQPVTSFPDINQIFTFAATPAGGGPPQVSQTAFKNTPTSQAIAITNLLGVTPDPFALAAAHLGAPLFVQWTLPSFTIADVQLAGGVLRADQTFCSVGGHLAPNVTSGSVTLPATCGGGAVFSASICVNVIGVLGEETVACHIFQDP